MYIYIYVYTTLLRDSPFWSTNKINVVSCLNVLMQIFCESPEEKEIFLMPQWVLRQQQRQQVTLVFADNHNADY